MVELLLFQNTPNNLYGSELECFCYYKSLRDYRLVESITHAPPFCVTVTAVASTFQKGQTPFLPQLAFSEKSLLFPATNRDEPTYRTLLVKNQASTPAVFEFPDSE